MKSQREVEIDAYIKANPSSEESQGLPLNLHGQITKQPVYRLPTRLLVFNIANGRFAAEALEAEKRLGRKLDATKEEDAKLIRKLLLEQDKGETENLKNDLIKNGQLDPGIITSDGAVINANRRLAIFLMLHEKTGDERYEYIRVARLPHGVGEKDLWKIEAKLQFGRDFRLEYGPINELLKIRAGKASGLSEKQISEALNHRYSEKQVGEKLRILGLIDTYLTTIGKPGEYRLIQDLRAVEKFISLQSNVITPLEKTRGKSTDIPKLVEIGFSMISRGQGGHRHWDIRRLKEIVELKPAKEALWKAFNGKSGLNKDAEKVSQAFWNAETILDAQQQRDKPVQLASDALSILQQVDTRHPSIRLKEFQEIIEQIVSETKRLSLKGQVKAKNASR
ncbi:MAG TPA: hypothetical protein VGY56_14395 [Verrucomicrobiae bacterium]|nr:hypothetical protein [Verrucomicrobiae bacterium]